MVSFIGPNADHLIDGRNENLSIADLPGAGTLNDGLNDDLNVIDRYNELQHDLRHEISVVLIPDIDCAVAKLAAVTGALSDMHCESADLGQFCEHWSSRKGWMMAVIIFMPVHSV